MPSIEPQTSRPRHLLQQVLIGAAGVLLTLLGALGLLLPVVPGLLFLAGAALCFSLISPSFEARVGVHLFKQPAYRLARRRWNANPRLPMAQRFGSVLATGLWALVRGSKALAQGRPASRQ